MRGYSNLIKGLELEFGICSYVKTWKKEFRNLSGLLSSNRIAPNKNIFIISTKNCYDFRELKNIIIFNFTFIY